MYDKGKVLIGLLIFLVLVSAPFWYSFSTGKASIVPVLERPVTGDECVRDSAYMVHNHMDLLNQWRDDVVRRGDRFETDADGIKYEKSLTNTCLRCHVSKTRFCDRCHNYVGVQPYCWDCHVIPEESQP